MQASVIWSALVFEYLGTVLKGAPPILFIIAYMPPKYLQPLLKSSQNCYQLFPQGFTFLLLQEIVIST